MNGLEIITPFVGRRFFGTNINNSIPIFGEREILGIYNLISALTSMLIVFSVFFAFKLSLRIQWRSWILTKRLILHRGLNQSTSALYFARNSAQRRWWVNLLAEEKEKFKLKRQIPSE